MRRLDDAELDELLAGMLVDGRRRRLGSAERERRLIRRSWTKDERRVVLRGLYGRATLACEALICGIGFAAITLGVFFAPKLSPQHVNSDIIVIAPVFGLGVLGCILWTIGVLFAPLSALAQTRKPIYVVDGFIRSRRPDASSPEDSNGYLAVLTDDGAVACEWPTSGDREVPDLQTPALCEFSEYGGVHTIDGRRTGVLPEAIPLLGVGIAGRGGSA